MVNLGLKDVDIDAKILSLKISWVRQLKDSNFHPWKVLANHLLSPVAGEAIFHTKLCLSERFRQRTNDLPLFYKELVLTGEKYTVSNSVTVGQIATQSLWNNKSIHTKSKSLHDESLVSKGIMSVGNLFYNEGELKKLGNRKSRIQCKEVPLLAILTRNILKHFPLSSYQYMSTIPEKNCMLLTFQK